MKNGPYEMIVAPDGYPGKKYRDRYAYEHHIVYWTHTNIVPTKHEVIHHINGKKRDNRIENLELVDEQQHRLNHAIEISSKHRSLVLCGFCLDVFEERRSRISDRSQKNKMGKLFCSVRCSAKYQFNIHSRLA